MKKYTKHYIDAIKNYALSQDKTKLLISEINPEVEEGFNQLFYEEVEYNLHYKKNDKNEWYVYNLAPNFTTDECIELDNISYKEAEKMITNGDWFRVRFNYEENFFSRKFTKNENGEFEGGYFMLDTPD